MSWMKIFALPLLLALALPTRGHVADLTDPVMVFAACAGRYSAEMEHRWLIGHDADEVTRKRSAMIDLVDAVITRDRARDVLARRIEAKMAQAALLQRATFNRDQNDSAQAETYARIALRRCERLLPGV